MNSGKFGIIISIKEDKIRLSYGVRTYGWQIACVCAPDPDTFLLGKKTDGSSQNVKPVFANPTSV
jgi:hypothetical protein